MCQAINQELVTKMEERLRKKFPNARFEIGDGPDGMHLELQIAAGEFRNKSLIDQHKMVYAAFDDLLKSGELHSVNIKTTVATT